MKHLITPFAWLDRKFEQLVVLGAIWMIRKGIRKSTMTYVLYITWIFGFFGSLWMDLASDLTSSNALSFGVGALLMVFMMCGAHLQRKADLFAEETNLKSMSDRPMPGPLRFFALSMLVWLPFMRGDSTTASSEICNWIGWLAYVLELYIRSAPRKPPPKKQESPINLQTAKGVT
jgi:hypothetical protein